MCLGSARQDARDCSRRWCPPAYVRDDDGNTAGPAMLFRSLSVQCRSSEDVKPFGYESVPTRRSLACRDRCRSHGGWIRPKGLGGVAPLSFPTESAIGNTVTSFFFFFF